MDKEEEGRGRCRFAVDGARSMARRRRNGSARPTAALDQGQRQTAALDHSEAIAGRSSTFTSDMYGVLHRPSGKTGIGRQHKVVMALGRPQLDVVAIGIRRVLAAAADDKAAYAEGCTGKPQTMSMMSKLSKISMPAVGQACRRRTTLRHREREQQSGRDRARPARATIRSLRRLRKHKGQASPPVVNVPPCSSLASAHGTRTRLPTHTFQPSLPPPSLIPKQVQWVCFCQRSGQEAHGSEPPYSAPGT